MKRTFDPLTGRHYSGPTGKDSRKNWVPSWAKEPLLADEPMLPQLEEKLLAVHDEEEFRRGLEWLTKHFYSNPDVMSLLENMKFGKRGEEP